jgi:hypothetical protein
MMRWAFGLFVLVLLAAPASADYRGWPQYLPGCQERDVLDKIAERAIWAENHTWHRGWVIRSVGNVRETALRDLGPSRIDRRYCYGVAWLTNGRTSELVYVIEAGQGFASIGWRVEFCLPRYDPWRVYGQWCRAIRP